MKIMMRWRQEEKYILGGFGLVVLLMGVVGFASYRNTSESIHSADRIQHTYEILNHLVDFHVEMTVAESGRRGYVFSGSQKELARHQLAVEEMKSELKILQQKMESDLQQQRLKQLVALATARMDLFARSIALYETNPSDRQQQDAITENSVALREKIQQLLNRMQDEEQHLLQQLLETYRTSNHLRIMIEIIGILLAFTVIVGVCFMLYHRWLQHKRVEKLERTLAQERELGDLKLRLFSMISHEFRTPLSVILASSQLLGEVLKNLVEADKLKNLSRIESSARLMNRLLTDILTLTRAEAGKLEFKPESLDVEAFCLNLLEELQFSNMANYAIQFSSEGHCTRIFLDEKLLYSILCNLLLNAIKYSPDGGTVSLSLRCEPEATLFKIKDEGIGIPAEDQPKIFEAFYRGQNTDQIAGTGLGLAVVKKCLELHNGSIRLESCVNGGTTCTVRIPNMIHTARYAKPAA